MTTTTTTTTCHRLPVLVDVIVGAVRSVNDGAHGESLAAAARAAAAAFLSCVDDGDTTDALIALDRECATLGALAGGHLSFHGEPTPYGEYSVEVEIAMPGGDVVYRNA